MRRILPIIFAALGLSAGMFATPATHAAKWRLVPRFSTSLTCFIEHEKIIVVVNSTGDTLAAGSRLTWRAVNQGSGQTYGETVTIGRTESGRLFRFGGHRSSSCTASVRPPPPAAMMR